jgi:hypothetical protein
MALSLDVIRWDAWWSRAPGAPALVEEETLSAREWQHLAPPHAVNVRPGRIQFDVSQARMDAEIGWANAAGVNWAFLMYSTGLSDTPGVVGMRGGLDLYIASTVKAGLKWCMIQAAPYMGAPGNFTTQINTIADLMVRADYKRVLSNRPMLYLYLPSAYVGGSYLGNNAAFAAAVAALRARVQVLGAGDPYIVALGDYSPAGAEVFRAAIGADAVSLYALGGGLLNGQTYAGQAARDAYYWAQWQTHTAAYVPIVTSGWDRRPRESRPGPWEPHSLPKLGSGGWVQQATGAELAAHITAAKAWTVTNAAKCPSASALMYSWNEFSEGGGCLCPTRTAVYAGTHTARLAAVKAALA